MPGTAGEASAIGAAAPCAPPPRQLQERPALLQPLQQEGRPPAPAGKDDSAPVKRRALTVGDKKARGGTARAKFLGNMRQWGDNVRVSRTTDVPDALLGEDAELAARRLDKERAQQEAGKAAAVAARQKEQYTEQARAFEEWEDKQRDHEASYQRMFLKPLTAHTRSATLQSAVGLGPLPPPGYVHRHKQQQSLHAGGSLIGVSGKGKPRVQ